MEILSQSQNDRSEREVRAPVEVYSKEGGVEGVRQLSLMKEIQISRRQKGILVKSHGWYKDKRKHFSH